MESYMLDFNPLSHLIPQAYNVYVIKLSVYKKIKTQIIDLIF